MLLKYLKSSWKLNLREAKKNNCNDKVYTNLWHTVDLRCLLVLPLAVKIELAVVLSFPEHQQELIHLNNRRLNH